MDPAFLAPLIPIAAIIAIAAVKQQEQAETQERLDFAERLLTKARDERRLEG
jgi:hypothetical protein